MESSCGNSSKLKVQVQVIGKGKKRIQPTKINKHTNYKKKEKRKDPNNTHNKRKNEKVLGTNIPK